jgi:hypothetical protein
MATATFLDRSRLRDPSYQAFLLLRTVFTIAPILFGLDKFTNLMTDWPAYLAGWIDRILPGDAATGMHIVGVIEIIAGILVAVAPRIGAYVVALWLAGIIVNLLTLPGFYDVALRDFGLLIAALALGRLADAQRATNAVVGGSATARQGSARAR